MRKDFIKRTLTNGIPVYFYKDKNLKRVVVSYNIKYGSSGLYDNFSYQNREYHVKPGMAHLLEHTLIEYAHSGNMLHHFLDKNYEFNGATYLDLTSYYFIGINDIKESLRELIEMIEKPAFTEENIKTVKNAIIEELKKVDDNKYGMAYNIHMRNLYKNFERTPEHGNMLGTVESTLQITYEEARACYNAYYNNENKFLVIGGNIDINDYMAYLESIFKNCPFHKNEVQILSLNNDFGIRTGYQEIVKPIDTEYELISYKFKNDMKLKKILLDLYLHMYLSIKFSNDKDFVASLVSDKIIVGNLAFNVDFEGEAITVTFSSDVLKPTSLVKRIEEEFKNYEIEEKEFNLYKRNLIANDLLKMDYIYRSIKSFPQEIDFTEKIYVQDIIRSIKLEDVLKFIKSLDLSLCSILLVKKEK